MPNVRSGQLNEERVFRPWLFACRPLLHAVVGGYATRAWGIEIDRVKCDKGNAFMRYAAAEMAKCNSAWGAFDVPAIRCAPIEDVRRPLTSEYTAPKTSLSTPVQASRIVVAPYEDVVKPSALAASR